MATTEQVDEAFAQLDRINDAMIKWSIPATMETSAVFLLLAAQSWAILGAERPVFQDLVTRSNAALRELRGKGGASEFARLPRSEYGRAISFLCDLASTNRTLRMRVILAIRASGIQFAAAATPPCLLATGLTLQARAGMPEEIVTGTAEAIYDLAEAELHELERLHKSRN